MARQKKRADGRYQKRVRLEDGTYKMVYGRTLAQLQEAVDRVREEDRAGVKVGDYTLVGEWAAQWLATYKTGLRAKTLEMYRTTYNCHIMEPLGGMALKDVRPVHVQQVMLSVADKSASLQNKVKLTLEQIFSSAQANGLILRNPTEGIKTAPSSAQEKVKHLTKAQAETLMAALQDTRAKAFCGLCLYCGLRREEALGLQWRDIKDGALTVNRAISFVNGRPDPCMDLKTKAAHRTIPVPEVLQEILGPGPHDSIWVVPAARGTMTLSAYRKLWDKVEAAVPFKVTAHMLRHTYATSLFKAGVDVQTAQRLLGHSSIAVTANIYTHLEHEDSLAAAGKINAYYAGA